MQRTWIWGIGLAMTLTWVNPAAPQERPRDRQFAEGGFTPLFDGKTLNGWTIRCLSKDKALGAKAWTVDQGTILANTMGHKEHFYIMLETDKEYGDFILRLRVQIERNVRGNSGIQIRSRYVAATGWMEGPQIDIDPPNPRGTTGKLWNEGPGQHRWLSNEPIKDLKFFYADQGDGWNDMEITAHGMKITSALNGVKVVDYDGSGVLDDELHKKLGVGVKGRIGLQIHSYQELRLRFKDIRIKELSPNGTVSISGSGAEQAKVAGLTSGQRPIPSVRRLAEQLPCTLDFFDVRGRPAFLIRPNGGATGSPTPWVWYAPVLGSPNTGHAWMLRQWLEKGIGMAGVDVGESYGSPQGRAVFTALWETLTTRYHMSQKACLLPQSRGGLMLYNWAVENPSRVACIAGIYTVCDLRSYPGLQRACGAYSLSASELEARLAQHNPIDRLASLAKARVPILHIHGDADKVVPLEKNSGELARRYRALGGPMRLIVIPGKGHQVCNEFFQCQELVDFVTAHSDGATKLFARDDLSGWIEEQHNFFKAKNPSVRTWSVKDGVLACDGTTGNCGFLRYEKKLSDFTLRLEFRIAKGCNSGVCIRTRVPYDGQPEKTLPSHVGYEVQILDDAGTPASTTSTGAFYGLVAPQTNAAKPAGQWNTLEIVCRGPKIRVTLNSQVVQDVDQTKIDVIRDRSRSGYLTLQNHGGNIEFRNIRLKEETPQVIQVAAKADVRPPKKPHVAITISKETTYITGPLRKDGYVDYVAALNERFRAGVTPENNAALPFLKAMWPGGINNPKHRDEYYRMLGIEPLPEKGDYYVSLDKYAERSSGEQKPTAKASEERANILLEKRDQAMKRPWSKQEFPILAGWLAANEKPLALVLAASKRPRRYDPLISGDGSVIGILLPTVMQYREAARAFAARAMLRVGEGRVNEAWEDLLACHRLARLAGQGPTLIEGLVAFAVDGIACAADQALLQHVQLASAQIARLRVDLDTLPPMPRMVDKIDVAERFFYLDCAGMVARHGVSSLAMLTGGSQPKSPVKSLVDSTVTAAVEWDHVLRMGNSWYDRMTDAFAKRTRAERQVALRKIDDDIHKLATRAKDWPWLGLSMLGNPRETVSNWVGQVLVCLLLPAVSGGANAEDRGTMRFDLTKLAFALAAYHADRGAYPAKLADLVPKYAAKIPKEIFNASELHYRQEGGGYLLYSVGPNGKDDGGKGQGDCKEGETWDDLAVRVPAATAKKQ